MALRLKARGSVSEGPSLVPSTLLVAHNYPRAPDTHMVLLGGKGFKVNLVPEAALVCFVRQGFSTIALAVL